MFDLRRAEDFKKAVVSYLESMLKAQEAIAQEWERYVL